MKVLYEDSIQTISQLYDTFHCDRFCIVSAQKEDNQEDLWIYRIKIGELYESFQEWGQDLVLNVFTKKDHKNRLVNVGPWVGHETNRLKLLPATPQHISSSISAFVGMATVPSRFNQPEFLLRLQHLLFSQSYPIAKLFITIPKTYKRFNETISADRIKEIESIDKRIEIILVEDDLGPALKYLGPILYKKDQIQNHALCIVDDDQFYSNYLIGHFMEILESHKDVDYICTDEHYWFNAAHEYTRNINAISSIVERSPHRPAGFAGFMIVMNSSNMGLGPYTLEVLNGVQNVFCHDEGILFGYQHKQNSKSLVIAHKGSIYYSIGHDDANCLWKTSGHLRDGLEADTFRYNNTH